MEKLVRTTSKNLDFRTLVSLLDEDLALRDGEEHGFYAQFNGLAPLNHALVLYQGDSPVACGAIKKFNDTSVEIKRMFVQPKYRGQGLASRLLTALETWAKELGYQNCVLETGLRQPEAIQLYKKNGYQVTPNYPPYEGVANSVCFKKIIL